MKSIVKQPAAYAKLTPTQREHLRLQVRALAKRAPEMLTPSEIEELRQDLKASSAKMLAAFRRKPLAGKKKPTRRS